MGLRDIPQTLLNTAGPQRRSPQGPRQARKRAALRKTTTRRRVYPPCRFARVRPTRDAALPAHRRPPKDAARSASVRPHVPWPQAEASRAACGSRRGAEPADKPGSVVDSHSSRRRVTATLKQPTRTRHGPCHCVPIWPCSGWGLPCRSIAGLAVRSYRTVSPLPDPSANERPSAVYSLLHFPSARAAQALPGILPCGARTFLDAHRVHRDCLADSAGHSVSLVSPRNV